MRNALTTTLVRGLFGAVIVVGTMAAAPSIAAERIDAISSVPAEQIADLSKGAWFRETTQDTRSEPAPPSKLAIIACRVEAKAQRATNATGVTNPDWLLPLECMRVIETVTDAAAMSNLWLRQMTPNLAEYGTCARVAMTYAPEWEASHRNWLIVKIGCPTKIVDADGRTIGWHMPACQGTLPGTAYPLRCRFDPSEI
ncbi:MAG: hypothetical protein QNJ62_08560 [Methyloceanibacter sp.]|nr:hypothetical protein [Methyloceanibacter sp.]